MPSRNILRWSSAEPRLKPICLFWSSAFSNEFKAGQDNCHRSCRDDEVVLYAKCKTNAKSQGSAFSDVRSRYPGAVSRLDAHSCPIPLLRTSLDLLMSALHIAIDFTKILDKVGSLIPYHGGALQPVLMAAQALLERAQVRRSRSVIRDYSPAKVETER